MIPLVSSKMKSLAVWRFLIEMGLSVLLSIMFLTI
jgi:hypothetical protein